MKPIVQAGARPRLRTLSFAISRTLAASALGLTASFVAPLAAQEPAGEGPALEEIVVTGSRIVRRDFESNSPIVTVNSEDFEQQTGLNIESYLNQMPQYNPAASPVTTDGDVQITPVNSVGIASISLRGFGPNRNLVLVDGKRMVPINPLMVTDINGIPSALIERTETITGGASAVYGADAVGGVTNFILKDDFEGFDLDLQTGMTQEGDGEESRISAVLGTNFSDGRGNVTIGFESYRREAALDRNHDRWREWWGRTDTPGTFAGFLNGVNGYACNGADCPFPGTVNALFSDSVPYGVGPTPNAPAPPFSPNGPQTGPRGFLFSPDGTIWTNTRGGLYRADGSLRYSGTIDGQEYGFLNSYDANVPTGTLPVEYQNLKWFHQRNYISAPQDRYSFFASGNFDVTDTVRAFARATFAESDTKTILFGTNAITGWETQVPYNPTTDSPVNPALNYRDPATVAAVRDNPAAFPNPNFIPTGSPNAHFPVPAQLAILLNSRTPPTYCLEGTFSGPLPCGSWGSNTLSTTNAALVNTQAAAPIQRWQPQWNPDDSLPPRNTDNVNEVWQVEAGIDFDIGPEWTGEFYLSHGESSTYNVAGGNLSLERYRQITNAPDYGRGASLSGNEPPNSQRPFFGAGDVTCTSGFYDTFFGGDQPLSQDCYEAVNATLQTRTQNEQNIIELNFQGPVAELPAGEVRMAAGYQSRRNSAQFYPDILQSQISFTDQVIGVYPTGYLDAETSVDDYYVEGLIPVLQGKRGVDRLELEIGARYSDYEHTEEENTWKALINWQVNDWLRFRGGFNRATRAPNLGELFLNPQEIFTGGGAFGDPCGLRSNSPFGAAGTGDDPVVGPGESGPQTQIAAGQTAAGAQSTRLICEALMGGAGSPAVQQYYYTNNAPAATGGGFAWVLQRGNPNLQSEVADTWTWGLVASLQNNLTLAFDLYSVDIQDAIMLYSLTYAGYRCFGTQIVTSAAEAAVQAATPGCQLVPRDLNNGNALNAQLSYDNQASIETAGMDVTVNWFRDIGSAGTLGINAQATFLDHYETRQSPAPFDPVIDWKGSLGPSPTLTGTNAGAYDYRLFGSVNFSRNNWNVGLRWRHLPSVWRYQYAEQQAIIQNNAVVSAGGPGLLLSYTPLTDIESDDYNAFDLSFGWDINDTLSLRGGITNLLDTDPVETGEQLGYNVNGTPTTQVCGSIGNPPGCLNPFSYGISPPGPVSSPGTWSGFYDTLGRRFFVGLSLRF
jgi:outer membrane receptor protein involved in Fe transport